MKPAADIECLKEQSPRLNKLLSRLKPSEGPTEGNPETMPISPKSFLALIEMMREHHRYDFADETLRGIYDTVAANDYVTSAQHAAVLNIRHSVKNWEDLEDP